VAYVSGSSPASLRAGQALGIGQLSFPLPPGDPPAPAARTGTPGTGISIGIIARDDSREAWRIARDRFPATPQGAERMRLLLSAATSSWQPRLASVPVADEGDGPYWLVPFRYHHSFCPYLVGSHDEVARAVTAYLNAGIRTLILDVPREPDDLHHARIAIERAITTTNTTTP
jgi:alkanesulfonate monooxygenase